MDHSFTPARSCPRPKQSKHREHQQRTASDEAIGHAAKQAVDASVDTDWESSGSPDNPSWIVLTWKDPMTIRELVIHRWKARRGAPDLTHLKAEIFEGGAWHDLAEIGNGKSPLPQTIYQRVPEHTITKLRLSGFDERPTLPRSKSTQRLRRAGSTFAETRAETLSAL